MTRLFLAVVALAAALPETAAAQRPPVESLPPPGTRVRVSTLGGHRLVGSLGITAGDTLVLTMPERRGVRLERRLPTNDVRELWVSRGRRRVQGAVTGFGIGLVGGAAIGASLGALTASEREGCDFCGKGVGAFFGAIGGAALGAPVGAVVGAVRGPERWERRWPMAPQHRGGVP